jgi:hypothetical protein
MSGEGVAFMWICILVTTFLMIKNFPADWEK